MTPPSFWLRCKRRLAGFQPAFLSMAEYDAFLKRAHLPPRTFTDHSYGWRGRNYRSWGPEPKSAFTRRKLRKMLQEDKALRKLLGEKEWLVEVVCKEDDLMIAVFPFYRNRRDYSTDVSARNVDLVHAYQTKNEERGVFRFVYTNQLGAFDMDYDYHIASSNNNPLYSRSNPVFVFRPAKTS